VRESRTLGSVRGRPQGRSLPQPGPSTAPSWGTIARRIDQHRVRWAMQKFKRLRGKLSAWTWLNSARQHQPTLFAPLASCRAHEVGLWEPGEGRPFHAGSARAGGCDSPRHSPTVRESVAGSQPVFGKCAAQVGWSRLG